MPLLLMFSRAAADVATVIIGVCFLLSSLAEKNWEWVKQPELRLLALLWLVLMLQAPFTPMDTHKALVSAAIWIRFPLLYAAARTWLLTTPQSLMRLAVCAGVALLMLIMDSAWQYITGTSLTGHRISEGGRITSALGHANAGNLLLKIALPTLGILCYALRNKRWLKWLLPPVILAGMAVIIVSGERSTALLMLLACAVIGGICFIRQPQLRRYVLLGGVLTVALLALLILTQPLVRDRVDYLVLQLSDFRNTYYGQLYLAAWGLWQKYPLTGIGAQQFVRACQQNMPGMHIFYCDMHPHNYYFEWLAAGGTLGFALFVGTMLLIIRRTLQACRFTGAECIVAVFTAAGLAVVLFPFIVTQSAFSNWPALLFWYSLALAASLPRMGRENA